MNRFYELHGEQERIQTGQDEKKRENYEEKKKRKREEKGMIIE